MIARRRDHQGQMAESLVIRGLPNLTVLRVRYSDVDISGLGRRPGRKA